jgi:hypothetical protein
LQLISGDPSTAASDSDVFISARGASAAEAIIRSFWMYLLRPAGYTKLVMPAGGGLSASAHYPPGYVVTTYVNTMGDSMQFIYQSSDIVRVYDVVPAAYTITDAFDLRCCQVSLCYAPVFQVRFSDHASREAVLCRRNGVTHAFLERVVSVRLLSDRAALLRCVRDRLSKYVNRGYRPTFDGRISSVLDGTVQRVRIRDVRAFSRAARMILAGVPQAI